MIKNLAERLKSDKALQKKVVDHMDSRIEGYRASLCYRVLYNRYHKLKDSYDLKVRSSSGNRAVNNWKTKIVYPLAREAMLIRRAVLLASFRNDPLITVRPGPGTIELAARMATGTLQSNLRNQKFRTDAFHKIINMTAKYGTGVVCSYPNYTISETMKTLPNVINGYQMGFKRTLVPQQRFGIAAKSIHPLNYWQNDHNADWDDSDFRGYTDRLQLAKLKALSMESDAYIKENVKKILDGAKEDNKTGKTYFEQEMTDTSITNGAVDLDYWWGTLPIKGNEDDDTKYYIEKGGEYILRVEDNPIDEDITPLDIFCIDKRDDFWWANTDAESVVPYENYLTNWMQMTADSGLRSMQQWVFYNKALGIDPQMINERAKNGGFIPFNPKPNAPSLRDAFQQVSMQDPSLGPMNSVAARVMEAADRIIPRKDFTRSEQAGGPKNSTATAALISDQEGNIQDAYYLNEFANGLASLGETQLVLLQQHLPAEFKIRPKIDGPTMNVKKEEIIGFYEYYTETSISRNKMAQAQNLLNVITAIQNFKGAGVDPTWMNVNISQIAREWFRSMDVGVDIDDVMPEQPPMQQQGMMPMGMPQMGGMGGMGGGSPVALPPPQQQQITAGGPQPAAGNIV